MIYPISRIRVSKIRFRHNLADENFWAYGRAHPLKRLIQQRIASSMASAANKAVFRPSSIVKID